MNPLLLAFRQACNSRPPSSAALPPRSPDLQYPAVLDLLQNWPSTLQLPFVKGVQINFSNSPRPRVKFDIKCAVLLVIPLNANRTCAACACAVPHRCGTALHRPQDAPRLALQVACLKLPVIT